jgi:hypothetical protein
MHSESRVAGLVTIFFLVAGLSAQLVAQPANTVLNRFADMVDPQYWANQTNEQFRDFIQELLPDLNSLIDEAVAERWPAAGNMSSAGSSLELLARGNLIWQAASGQMLLQNMQQTAGAAGRQALASCLRDLADQGSSEKVAQCRSSAAFYRTMLISPESSSVSRYNQFWSDIVRGPAGASRSALNQVVFSIERVLEGIASSQR